MTALGYRFWLPFCLSSLALVISLFNYLRSHPKIMVKIFDKPLILTGTLGYYNSEGKICNIESYEDITCYVFDCYIANSKSYPIALFDINVFDEKNNKLKFLMEMNIINPDFKSKLFIETQDKTTKRAIDLPYSRYHNIPAGSFFHLSLVIKKSEILSNNSKVVTIYFRDTSNTLFPVVGRKHNVKSFNNPIHSKSINLDLTKL